MNIGALHDCFYDYILPFLFKIETNYTILVHKTISKTAYRLLDDLVDNVFTVAFSSSVDHLISCDFDSYAAIVSTKQINRVFVNKIGDVWNNPNLDVGVSYTLNSYTARQHDLLIRHGYSDNYADSVIYRDSGFCGFLSDDSMSLDLRLKYLETYYPSWKSFLDNRYNLITLMFALHYANNVSSESKCIILPYFDKITSIWMRISREIEGPIIEWIKERPDSYQRIFKRLGKYIYDERINIRVVHFVSIVCMIIDQASALNLLRLNSFYNVYENNPNHVEEYRCGMMWDKEGRNYRITDIDVKHETQLFSNHITSLRTGNNPIHNIML